MSTEEKTSDEKRLDHVLRVSFEAGDFSPTMKVECRAPVGAECRLGCAEKCDSETYPCFDYNSETGEATREHQLVDQGECNAVLFIEDGDVAEACEADGVFPIHDGMPVEITWDGDGYMWSPVAESLEASK